MVLLLVIHVVWYTLFQTQSLVMVHTNLIAITYLITITIAIALLIAITFLIADHDLDSLLDCDRLADRGFLLDRLIANVIFPMPITPSAGLVPFDRRSLTRYRRYHPV